MRDDIEENEAADVAAVLASRLHYNNVVLAMIPRVCKMPHCYNAATHILYSNTQQTPPIVICGLCAKQLQDIVAMSPIYRHSMKETNL